MPLAIHEDVARQNAELDHYPQLGANSSEREVKRVVMAVTLTPKKNKLKTLFVGAEGGSAG